MSNTRSANGAASATAILDSAAPDSPEPISTSGIVVCPGTQGLKNQAEELSQDHEDQDGRSEVEPEAKRNLDDEPYSVFNHNEKRIIVICAGVCAFFSPISGQIYFPSLDTIAKDLHVSDSLVNLTITVYLVLDSSGMSMIKFD